MHTESIFHSMPWGVFGVMLLFPAAMAGIGVFVSLRSAKRARIIAATPTSPIGSAPEGFVELEGTIEAVGGENLIAPLTDSKCCWYHAKVEKWTTNRSSDSETSSWSSVREVTSEAPFLLRDATGVCAVWPNGAEVTATDHSVWYGATPEPEDRNPPRVGPGESGEGMVRVSGTKNTRFRYSEERIYVGDRLYALGELGPAVLDDDDDVDDDGVDDDANLDDRVGDAGMADADPAGEGDPGEAGDLEEERREALELEVAHRMMVLARSVTPNRLARPASRDQLFLLSTTPQEKLLEVHRVGSKGALILVAIGLGLDGLLLWARFG